MNVSPKLKASRAINGILLLIVLFLAIRFVFAATPNPGHPWTELGDGVFAITGPTALRTFTFPNYDATVLTSTSTISQGDILIGVATNTLLPLAKNTTASRYLSNSGTSNAPAWAQVDMTNGVTGTLPVGNGGTGLASPGASGNVLTSNGTTWTSSAAAGGSAPNPGLYGPVGLYMANLTAVTAVTTNTTHFVYMGVATGAYTTCNVLMNVTTASTNNPTWSEVAVFEGNLVLNGNASLTRSGFTNTATTHNSTGRKNTTVTVSNIASGDGLWVAYGSQATTPFQIRGMLADDIQSGVFQTDTSRPSTAASPEATTLGTATAVPGRVALKCS